MSKILICHIKSLYSQRKMYDTYFSDLNSNFLNLIKHKHLITYNYLMLDATITTVHHQNWTSE